MPIDHGYIYTFEQHGQFSPEGKVVPPTKDVDAHNAILELAELRTWALGPPAFAAYVNDKRNAVTTWQGKALGTIVQRSTYRNNLGARITSVRVRGTNGCMYHGRYGSDWSQLVRLRKCR